MTDRFDIIGRDKGESLFNRPNSNSYNLNLKQRIDNRRYEVNHTTYSQTNNTINNNLKPNGFFKFIYDIISLPIIMPYKLVKLIWIKTDMKNKIDKEKIQNKKLKFIKKYVHKTHDIYDTEEIF